MNISLIKEKAKQLLEEHYSDQYKKILIMILIMSGIPSLYAGNNFLLSTLSAALGILFITLDHGIIVSSLKIAENRGHELNDEDTYVGIRRWLELLPTYVVSGLFVYGISIVISVLLILVTSFFISVNSSAATLLNELFITSYANAFLTLLTKAPNFALLILFMIIFVSIVTFVLSSLVFAMPYLYEKEKLTPFHCLKKSISLMKNYIIDYIKLELSFIGWILLVSLANSVLTLIVAGIPFAGLIVTVLYAVITVYVYYPKYSVSRAIFFEEMMSIRNNGEYYNEI